MADHKPLAHTHPGEPNVCTPSLTRGARTRSRCGGQEERTLVLFGVHVGSTVPTRDAHGAPVLTLRA